MPIRTTWLLAASLVFFLTACDPGANTPQTSEQKNAMEMADKLRKSGNLDGAAGIYRELAAKEDGSVIGHIALAEIYRKSRQPTQAVAIMRDAQKRQPANESVLLQLGYALIAAGQPKEAVNVFDMLTAINHDSAQGYNGKAVAFDNAGNHTAAQELYQKALTLDSDSATIKNNLALSMVLNGDPGGAIAILEPMAQQKDATATMRHNLALAYGVKGDSAKAREINLRDMGAQAADENQKFYDHYRRMMKSQQVTAIAPRMEPALNKEVAKPVKLIPKPAPVKPAAKTPAPVKPEAEPEADAGEEKETIAEKLFGPNATTTYPTGERR